MSNLEDAKLFSTNLQHATLVRANLQGANFQGASLQNADLLEANLTRASFYLANLQDAKLFRARLGGAKFADAVSLVGTDLEGAVYDANTTWPEGFDPQAAGARPLGENEDSRSVPSSDY